MKQVLLVWMGMIFLMTPGCQGQDQTRALTGHAAYPLSTPTPLTATLPEPARFETENPENQNDAQPPAGDDGTEQAATDPGQAASAIPDPARKPAGMTITRISRLGKGSALMEWHTVGHIWRGFEIVWSNTRAAPTFHEDTSTYIGDPAARSAVVFGAAGSHYFYRICQVNDQGGCTGYSNSYAYTFEGSPPGTPGAERIVITSISSPIPGKARVSWEAAGEFPNGFMLVWSSDHAYPVFPGDPAAEVADGTARSEVAGGEAGVLYYFRVCGFNGSTCVSYSQPVPFRYPAETTPAGGVINITSVTQDTPGAALVRWNADGQFPSGFIVTWSDTHPDPVYPGDNSLFAADPAARLIRVSGLQGKSVYFRVCRLTSNRCDIYSQNATFTSGGPIPPVPIPMP